MSAVTIETGSVADSGHAYQAIAVERIKQHRKWRNTGGDCSRPDLPNDTRLRILLEEVGEVARALNDKEPVDHLEAELIQVAAVCVGWIEGLNVR